MGRVRGARRGLADGCLYNGMPAARAAHGIGHGASCRDHPSTPGSGWDGRLRPCAFPDAPLCLLGLAAQRAHDDPEILRIDGARPVLIEQVERVLDLIELVLIELLLSSVELALRSLLGLRTSARAWSAAGATTRGVRSHAHLALLVVLRFACHGAVHDGARSFRNVDSVWHACACMPYAHTYA